MKTRRPAAAVTSSPARTAGVGAPPQRVVVARQGGLAPGAPRRLPGAARSPATPILLLGRRDGPAFVYAALLPPPFFLLRSPPPPHPSSLPCSEWCNLERSKRVKPFRCGEADLEDLIRRAEEQAARRRRASAARNARKEDAVLQALDIERARLRLRPRAPPPSCPPPPPPRKRKTPNDSEDDAPAARRMRDLTAPPRWHHGCWPASSSRRLLVGELGCGITATAPQGPDCFFFKVQRDPIAFLKCLQGSACFFMRKGH